MNERLKTTSPPSRPKAYPDGMSKAMIAGKTGEVVQFRPEATNERLAYIDSGIIAAIKLKDFAMFEAAVDAKLAEIEQIVAWWTAVVTPRRESAIGQAVVTELSQRTVPVPEAEKKTGIGKKQISRWRRLLATGREAWQREILNGFYTEVMDAADNHRAQGTGQNEWYTPPQYIAAAREVLGGIDLDPASSAAANKTVQAKRFFTIADDGLSKPWKGRVWLNPPYSQPDIA